ncbi:monooxygenase [Delitschia confertaspora ATCC 74209]|uniref:Monooxygenase n=1 Tax=Delitschia confertaspora ATCC 74209 TaxID=1513339 RepID=A0A9P4JTW6_9PLEO|nr:monooxygenase [Delitschia confertaspora ATCC 74209]
MIGASLRWKYPKPNGSLSKSSKCDLIAMRREWRTLSMAQKHQYLEAVKCLKRWPSSLGLNQSYYDDFPWIHSRIGEYVHDAAPFLAWHRYFVHVYEIALMDACAYDGTIPYWNWELDWEDVTASPIWDAEHGFGSNGQPNKSKEDIVKGYCVSDGPFKEWEILYLDEEYYPHCLSRGFLTGEELEAQSESLVPERIEELLDVPNYNSFNLGLENGPHLAIPRSIRGDFSLLTAPSDPVFFLHHTQLDRLWWRWQSRERTRIAQYEGLAAHHSHESASITDLLKMGGLAPDIPVLRVLDTESEPLCYRY